MFQYHYCNSALIIYTCTIYFFYTKKRINDNQGRIFAIMLWMGFLSSLFDILSEIAIANIGKYPIWSINLVIYIYFIVQNSIPFLSSIYALELINRLRQLELREKVILYTPILLSGVLILSNHWTKLLFYIDDSNRYLHGVGFFFLFFQTGYYLIINIVYSFYYKRHITKKMRYLLMFLSIFIMLIIVFDLYLEAVLIQSFYVSICLLLLFVVIQNNEEILMDSYGLLTKYAFINRAKLDLTNQYPFTVILIKMEDKAIINYSIGLNTWFAILNEVSAYLESIGRTQTVYNLEDGLYAIKMRHGFSSEEKDSLIEGISSKFESSKWNIQNNALSISIQMLELCYPKDFGDINDMQYYIKYFDEKFINSQSTHLTLDDLAVNMNNRRREQKKKLWDILDSFQYELCFMPVYSVSQRRIISREALLKLSTVPPVYLSPCELDNESQDYRQLWDIHKKIFEDICVYIKGNLTDDENSEYISLNVSTVQLMKEDLIEQYCSITREHMIDHKLLGIEMTEITFSNNLPMVRKNTLELGRRGTPIILDHFGTGYNSLEYLEGINFKYVKLDKSIVRACLDDEKGLTVLKSVIAMMNKLKATIIADGVDTKELADLLTSLGIDLLEGTYYL